MLGVYNRKTKISAAAHSANEPQRAFDLHSRLLQAEKECDEEIATAFVFILAWMQKSNAPAAEIALVTQYHTAWHLRKQKINLIKEAKASLCLVPALMPLRSRVVSHWIPLVKSVIIEHSKLT